MTLGPTAQVELRTFSLPFLAHPSLCPSPLLAPDTSPHFRTAGNVCLWTVAIWRGRRQAMVKCFDNGTAHRRGYPDPVCIKSSVSDRACLDRAMDPFGAAGRDDFDRMAGHYLQYVQAALDLELRSQAALGEATMSRCPFGTMTQSDGKSQLADCLRRSMVSYLDETIDMVLDRVNPLHPGLLTVNWTKTQGHSASSLRRRIMREADRVCSSSWTRCMSPRACAGFA